MAAFEPVMPAIQPVLDAGKVLFDWVSSLLGPVDASEQEWKSWGQTLGTNVGNAIAGAIKGIQDLIGWIGNLPQEAGKLVFDIQTGVIAPFLEWLWDIAMNGLKIAVDVGKAAADFAGGAAEAAGDAVGGAVNAVKGLFGGTKAVGGSVAPRVPYLVGELGPELFVPDVSGSIVTAARTARMLSDISPVGTGRYGASNDNAANRNARGPATITFTGDFIIQGGANATAEDIADAIGNEVGDRISATFSDGGF
jgi:hypothetical protein